MRSDLMIALHKRLQDLGLSQTKAASLLGVSQPRVSDLTRGRIDRFSVDALVKMLGKAGMDVRASVRPHSKRSVG
jgi:predicted XRE-type DNA-binding protein